MPVYAILRPQPTPWGNGVSLRCTTHSEKMPDDESQKDLTWGSQPWSADRRGKFVSVDCLEPSSTSSTLRLLEPVLSLLLDLTVLPSDLAWSEQSNSICILQILVTYSLARGRDPSLLWKL